MYEKAKCLWVRESELLVRVIKSEITRFEKFFYFLSVDVLDASNCLFTP